MKYTLSNGIEWKNIGSVYGSILKYGSDVTEGYLNLHTESYNGAGEGKYCKGMCDHLTYTWNGKEYTIKGAETTDANGVSQNGNVENSNLSGKYELTGDKDMSATLTVSEVSSGKIKFDISGANSQANTGSIEGEAMLKNGQFVMRIRTRRCDLKIYLKNNSAL